MTIPTSTSFKPLKSTKKLPESDGFRKVSTTPLRESVAVGHIEGLQLVVSLDHRVLAVAEECGLKQKKAAARMHTVIVAAPAPCNR